MSSQAYPVERCRTKECGASIIWARTNTGRSMPVDAEPSENGNVLLEMRQGFVRAVVLGKNQSSLGAPVRTSHFVTCVKAAEWRAKR